MALISRINGWASGILRFMLMDNSSSTGGAKLGLTNISAGLSIATIADGEASATTYTAAGGTIDTIATLGTYVAPAAGHCRFGQVDSTNLPGLYELQLSNTRFAVPNADSLVVIIQAPGSNVSPQGMTVDLDAQVDIWSVGSQASPNANGLIQVNTVQLGGSAPRVLTLGLELDNRITGTVTSATFTPTTTSFECSDITDSASNVYINRAFLVTGGTLIRSIGVILGDIVGTSGHRFTTTAMRTALSNGDTIIIL